MAVFTAIASAIVGAITGAGFTATFSAFFAGTLGVGATIGVALISGGLGMATAKLLGPDVPSIQAAKDPGVKVQLNPATDNRVPVFYGRVFTGAIAVDAEIKNQNNTMVYVFCIGEKTTTGNYTINNIYRGDSKLNFTGASVNSITDPNATSTTNIAGNREYKYVHFSNAEDISKGLDGEEYKRIVNKRNTKGREYVLNTFSPKICIDKYLTAIGDFV